MEDNSCDVCPWYVDRGDGYCRKGIITLNEYSPERCPKYDNYDAINVDRVKDIPYDYSGCMGVPITFLDKYCPEQFTIICVLSDNRCGYPFVNGVPPYTDEKHKNSVCGVLNGKGIYPRILIQIKKSQI